MTKQRSDEPEMKPYDGPAGGWAAGQVSDYIGAVALLEELPKAR